MSLSNHLLKVQFKVDHRPVLHRVGLLIALLLSILMLWFFMIYQPITRDAAQIQQQLHDLNQQTNTLMAKNDEILQHVKNHDLDQLILKYEQIKKSIHTVDQQLTRYHNRYVDDRVLAQLLHALLLDLRDINIENFSTTIVHPAAPKDVSPASSKKTEKPIPQPSTQTPLSPDMTYYSLTLKGGYFAIMTFLHRIEELKWQLFWTKLDYHVENYPQAIVTVEFFTLKPSDTPVHTIGVTP